MAKRTNCDDDGSTTCTADDDRKPAATSPFSDDRVPPSVEENKTKNKIPSGLLAVGWTNNEKSDEEEDTMVKKLSATIGMNLYWENEFRRESLLKKDGCDVSSELALGTSDQLYVEAGERFESKEEQAFEDQPEETEQLNTSSPPKLKRATRNKRKEAASAPLPALKPGAYAITGVDSESMSVEEHLSTSSPPKLKRATRNNRKEAASAPLPALKPGAYAITGVDSESMFVEEHLSTSSPPKSLKGATRNNRKEVASAPLPTLKPGAYAIPGFDSESTSVDRRNSATVEEVLASLGQNEQDVPMTSRDLRPAEEAPPRAQRDSFITNLDSLVKANMVDDAEPVFEAQDVRHDRFKRYMAAGSLALLALVAIVVMVVLLTSEDDGCPLEEMCCKPLDIQTSFERCYCSNTTSGMFESLSEEGHEIFDQLSVLVKLSPYWSSFGTKDWDVESCNPLNQIFLHIGKNEAWGLTPVQRQNMPLEVLFMGFYLLTTFALMDGIHWDINDGWTRGLDACGWYGVGCMFLDVFHELRLPNNGLSGTLLPTIGEAKQLRVLDLSGNNISGTIPSGISSLTNLNELKLSDLQLTGTLPSEIGSIPKLRSLSLENNRLTGSIPGAYFALPYIQEVSLAMNNITGTLPASLYDADQLAVLRLSGNKMTGMIPTELSNLSNLELINLGENRFSGTIPEFLGAMPRLQFINFYHSGLTGTIPESFCQRGNGAVDFVKIVVDCSISPPSCSCCDSHPATSKFVRVTCGETVPEQGIKIFND